MKKTLKTKKVTKWDLLTESTSQDYAHRDSLDIMHVRKVMTCQLDTVEEKIEELMTELANARTERARVGAILAGLGNVIGKR